MTRFALDRRRAAALALLAAVACGESTRDRELSDASHPDASHSDASHPDASHPDASHSDASHLDAAVDTITPSPDAPAHCVPGRTTACPSSDPEACLETRFCNEDGTTTECQCHACTGIGLELTFHDDVCRVTFDEPLGPGWMDALQLWAPETGEIFRVANESACSAHGWFIDSSDESVGLCPATCAAIAANAKLQVIAGCATIWAP